MVVQSLGSLGTMLRWCAPELMRLCLGDFLVDKFALVANEATDVYAFGQYIRTWNSTYSVHIYSRDDHVPSV